MSDTLANVVGLIGSGVMIVAYAYSNMAKQIDFLLFNLVNLLGSLLLISSLMVHFNVGAMVMEIAWSIIAVLGMIQALRKKGQP